jgi:hypothetical protein
VGSQRDATHPLAFGTTSLSLLVGAASSFKRDAFLARLLDKDPRGELLRAHRAGALPTADELPVEAVETVESVIDGSS